MRHIVFFTFLFTNMVSAAAAQEDAPTFFRWNPYCPTSSMTQVSHNHPTSPQALTSSVSSPALTEMTDAPETLTPPQALTVSSASLAFASNSLSDIQIKAILTEIEILASCRTSSSEFQQSRINQLLEGVSPIDSSKNSLSVNNSDQLFESLRTFLNREYTRLGQGLTTTSEQCVKLRQQYQSILMFCDEITMLTLFSTDQIKKLRCYHVSFLIGTANVCGLMKDNPTKKDYLEQALEIINAFTQNINDPYGDGTNFIVAVLRMTCTKKIKITERYIDQASASN